VALGGSLIQDIASQCKTDIEHDEASARNSRTHEISVEPGSLIANAMEAEHLSVNSFHHQSVKRVADGMRVTARAPDGVIEGIESTDDNWWVMAVQWHPEEMTESPEPWDRGLFKAFARKLEA
jgi:putative glutamine amidotransferase